MSLEEQELFTIPEQRRSPLIFSGVRIARCLGSVYCFVDRCLSFCNFSFCHCVVCPSIYEFWLPLRYLQNIKASWKTDTCISSTLH